MGAFLRDFWGKMDKNSQDLGWEIVKKGQLFVTPPKFSTLFQTQNLTQIIILLSNMPQFNHMAELWIFASNQNCIDPPKSGSYLILATY